MTWRGGAPLRVVARLARRSSARVPAPLDIEAPEIGVDLDCKPMLCARLEDGRPRRRPPPWPRQPSRELLLWLGREEEGIALAAACLRRSSGLLLGDLS